MLISVIIPCKNERDTIGQCVTRLHAVLPDAEVIVIDSATDDTRQVLNQINLPKLNLRYFVSVPDRGKGDAVKQGIEASQGDVMVLLDADLQFDPEDIPLVIQRLQTMSSGLVIGSRFCPDSFVSWRDHGLLRWFGNRAISFWFSVLFRAKIFDSLSGLKAWTKTVSQSFELEFYDFSYEVELLAKALKNGFSVSEIPVRYQKRNFGQSHVSVFRVGFKLLCDIFLLRFVKDQS